MRLSEIILVESGYHSELLTAVQDLMTRYMAKGAKQIPTENFKQLLAKQGFVTSTEELIQAVDTSGFASSVDREKIIPNNQLPDSTDDSDGTDVGAMAGSQAIKDIKADL
jgi:hypothetical protein